ncbi:MAG: wax ester/triacylglycerol synthase domain-containing protein [Candidatus Nanopelagicales bacterium]
MTRKVDSRMGVFDAVMWGVETDPLLRSVITLVVMLDKKPNRKVLTQRIEEMSIRVPALRRRVVGNPVSLVPPRWESTDDFDMNYHLRFRRAANTRDDAHVLDVAEHMAEMDFDRARPLWEAIVIEGLKGNRAALIMKIHHAITDGIGGMAMAASLFDLSDDPSQRPEQPMPDVEETGHEDAKERIVEGAEYQAKTTVDQIKDMAGGAKTLVTGTVTDPVGTVKNSVDFTQSAARILAPASTPMSPVMRGRSLGVHFAILEAPLDALKVAGKSNGGTLNDAFMAVVSGGIAKYHAAHGVSLDEAAAVRVNMPVNLRPRTEAPTSGNRWVPARFPLPLGPEDPVARVRELHPVLLQARTEPALEISEPIFRLLTSLPRPATTALAAGMMKGTDVAATNVPGPPIPVYLAGAQVQQLVPFAPKGGAAMNVAMMSYNGKAEFGVNLDTAAIYDHDVMIKCLEESLAEVVALSVKED